MKAIKLALTLSLLGCMTYGVNIASASFGVNLATTTSDILGTQATRLFNDAAFTDASEVGAETGDPIWLVFDVDGDGIFASGALSNPNYDGTQAGLRGALIDADDYVIFSSVLGPIQGRNNAAFTGLPSSLQTGGVGDNDAGGTVKPAFALVFDDANIANGVTFGVNGALTASGVIPNLNNVQLRIGENTAADTYSASVGTVVPPQPMLSNVVAQATSSNVVVGFSFLTTSGASYQIQSTTNLAPPIAWSNEVAAIPGTGSVTNVSVTNGPPLIPEKFFRVQAN